MKEDWSTEGDRFWATMIINGLAAIGKGETQSLWVQPLQQAIQEGRWDLIEWAAKIQQAINAPRGDKKHAKEQAKHLAFCLSAIGLDHNGDMAMEYVTDPMTKGDIIEFIWRSRPDLRDALPTSKGQWRNWWKEIDESIPRSAGKRPPEWKAFFKRMGL